MIRRVQGADFCPIRFETWAATLGVASLVSAELLPRFPRLNGVRLELPPGRRRDAEIADARAIYTNHTPTYHCRAVALATGAEPTQPQGERKRASRNERAACAKPTALGACANEATIRRQFGGWCCRLEARRPGQAPRRNRRAAVERGAVDGEANRQAIERATNPWGNAAVERVAGSYGQCPCTARSTALR